jgi:hypothetical protein
MKYLILLLALLAGAQAFGQDRYLIADRYTAKRIKMQEGDPIGFELKGEKTQYKDFIGRLHQDSIYLVRRQMSIPVSDISVLYFDKSYFVTYLRGGTGFIGTGFLLSAAVHPLMRQPMYDRQEAFFIGSSFWAVNRLLGLFRTKKFKINEKSRLRVLHLQPSI